MLKLVDTTYAGEVTEEMVDYVRKLVRAKCRVRPVPSMEVEDVEQLALEETVKYIHKYDPKKAPLSGFMAVITNSAVGHARRYSLAGNRWNGEQPISYEQAELTDIDHNAFMDRSIMTLCFKLDLFYFGGLNSLEQDIVDLLYQGLTRTEICDELRLPRKDLNVMIAKIGEKYLTGSKAE